MKRSMTILVLILVLALVQMACSLPRAAVSGSSTSLTVTPREVGVITSTDTVHPVITATSHPSPSPTSTRPAPTATTTPDAINTSQRACTYKIAFLGDATIPDDTVIEAGSTFVKSWTVRNDGTCTWEGNDYTLVFMGGSRMGAPYVVLLRSAVQPGQTINISVNLTAPTVPGTYTSHWVLRVDDGPNNDQPLYARIQVGGELIRMQFEPGTTTAIVTGSLEASETLGYLVAAQQDQVIIAATALQDQEGGVRVKITTRENIALPDLSGNLAVVAALPETGDYIVWVSGGSRADTYHLAVTIPIRINFDPGAVSASLDGSILNGRAIWYVLRASAGQTLTASLDGANVGLIIAGLENPQVLTSSGSSWTGTLPATQNYAIQVMPTVGSTTYTLHVTVQ